MKNFSSCPGKMNLNFNYDKSQNNKEKKAKNKFSSDKINSNNPELFNVAKKYLDGKKIKKEKGEIEHSYMCPKFKDEKELFKEKDEKININIINDNNKIKNINKDEEKEKEIFKDNDKKENELLEKIEKKEEKDIIQSGIIINSINEIRLPKELYDISYDILQNQ